MMINKIKSALIFLRQFVIKNQLRKKDCDIGNNNRLYYWRIADGQENLGDFLSKIVVNHFAPVANTSIRQKGKTLYAIGSILGFRCQNAVVWGSGILSPNSTKKKNIQYSDLDIRAVRGPKTRALLLEWEKDCPAVYGDPALLLPLIYKPDKAKKYNVSVIYNHEHSDFDVPENEDLHFINILTDDYKGVIDQIVQSSLVISSSLHGIILAEVYGVPAVLLQRKDAAFFKFEDYYHSTGRHNIVVTRTISEALRTKPMELPPNISVLQEGLLKTFPYDLWNN